MPLLDNQHFLAMVKNIVHTTPHSAKRRKRTKNITMDMYGPNSLTLSPILLHTHTHPCTHKNTQMYLHHLTIANFARNYFENRLLSKVE